MNQYTDTRSGDRSELAAATAAFFQSGGRIEQLEPFTYKPYPPRNEPAPTPAELARRAFVEKVREMAKTMSKHDMATTLKVSHHRIYETCKRYRIFPKAGLENQLEALVNNAEKKRTAAQERREKLLDRVRALASIGLNRKQVATQVELCMNTLRRLIRAHNIEFPGRPKK